MFAYLFRIGSTSYLIYTPGYFFFLALALKLKIGSQQRKQRQTKKRFASLSKWTINVSRWIDLRKTAKMVQNGVRSYLKNHLFSYTCHGRFMMWKNTRKNWQRFSYLLEVWIAELCKKFHNGFLSYQQDKVWIFRDDHKKLAHLPLISWRY